MLALTGSAGGTNNTITTVPSLMARWRAAARSSSNWRLAAESALDCRMPFMAGSVTAASKPTMASTTSSSSNVKPRGPALPRIRRQPIARGTKLRLLPAEDIVFVDPFVRTLGWISVGIRPERPDHDRAVELEHAGVVNQSPAANLAVKWVHALAIVVHVHGDNVRIAPWIPINEIVRAYTVNRARSQLGVQIGDVLWIAVLHACRAGKA